MSEDDNSPGSKLPDEGSDNKITKVDECSDFKYKYIGCQARTGRKCFTRTVKEEPGVKTAYVLWHQVDFPCPNPGCDEMKDIRSEVERCLLCKGVIKETDIPLDERKVFNHGFHQEWQPSHHTKEEDEMKFWLKLLRQMLGHLSGSSARSTTGFWRESL